MRKIWFFLKRIVNVFKRKDLLISTDISIEKKKFGSSNAGWTLAPKFIDEKSIIYSFGIGTEISFDLSLIEQFNVNIYAFDPTPNSIEWIKSQSLPTNFKLNEYGISDYDGLITFYPPENPLHISHSIVEKMATKDKTINVNVKKLETIMSELGHEHIDVLKMDIEGAEYSVIEDIQKSGIRPIQILIEFHHRFSGIGLDKTKIAIKSLKQMGYKLFSVSDNGEEYSFILYDNK